MTQGMLRRTIEPVTQQTDVVELGRGRHGSVELDPNSMLVCKQFHTGKPEEAAKLSLREFEYLHRFSTVLASESYLSCPKPIKVEPEQGRIWMTYCPGKSLDELLLADGFDVEKHVIHLAEQIALALARYIGEFGEPFYDMATKHVVYEPESGVLSFVDFASRAFHRKFALHHSPWEISVGTFLGFSIYEAVRPATFRNLNYRWRQQLLAVHLLEILKTHNEFRLPMIREVSAIVYSRLGPRGKPLRWMWYSTVGQFLFDRRSEEIIGQAGTNNQLG